MRYTGMMVSIFVIGELLCGQPDQAHIDAVLEVVSKYERPFTLLEIGKSNSLYVAQMPLQKRMICELLILGGDAPAVLSKMQPKYHPNISLMVPPNLTCDMLATLSRCEHFDIVIVHDISSCLSSPYQRIVSVLTSLGDHVFMAVESEEYEDEHKKKGISCVVQGLPEKPSLYVSHIFKKGLDLARYTQKKERSSKPRYTVHSTYQHKEFYKKGLAYPVPWVHGINLITFCMFHGVYPDDQALRRELARLRKRSENHNDLVIGNFILQGSRLIAIDTKDTRRNSDPYNLLNSALDAFKRGNTRLHDPQGWINAYYLRLKS